MKAGAIRTSIDLPRELHRRLHEAAARRGCSARKLILESRSPNSLSFPDINVWLALASSEHDQAVVARRWWSGEPGRIAFTRLTQIGLLRLMTTPAAMDGKPLSMAQAWDVHDRFFHDDRVEFVAESRATEAAFRELTGGQTLSPKLWADAWLWAVARAEGGIVVTFDRALARRGARCLAG